MNTPKLRFKEFTEDWESKALGDIATFLRGKGVAKADITTTGKQCIRYGELYTTYKEVIYHIQSKIKTQPNYKYIFSKVGDILIPASGEKSEDIATASALQKDNIIIGGDINIIRTNNNNSFLAYYFNHNKRKEIAKLSQGKSVVHLYNEHLKQLQMNLPTIKEQEKIANFLMLIDKKIILLENQKSKLEDYKKTLSTKLLTQIIRFKGFTDDWQTVKLGEIVDVKKGKQLNKQYLSSTGKYYVLNGGRNPSGYYNTYNTKKNTISISEGGESCGYVTYNKSNFWAGGHCYILLNISIGLNSVFLYNYLKSIEVNIMRLRVGSGLPNIQVGSISSITIPIPTLEEQEKIAQALSNIDKLITRKQIHLTQTKKYKTYLLQNMFV